MIPVSNKDLEICLLVSLEIFLNEKQQHTGSENMNG